MRLVLPEDTRRVPKSLRVQGQTWVFDLIRLLGRGVAMLVCVPLSLRGGGYAGRAVVRACQAFGFVALGHMDWAVCASGGACA